VGAVVQAPDRVRAQRPEAGDAHPGRLHPVDELRVHAQGAHPVEQDVDGHALLGLGGQRLGDLDGDLALPVDVRRQVHRAPGAADRLQEGREDLVAVDPQLDLVAVGDRRAGQHLGRPQEVARADVQALPAELVARALLRRWRSDSEPYQAAPKAARPAGQA
jgi:hypothetical protein